MQVLEIPDNSSNVGKFIWLLEKNILSTVCSDNSNNQEQPAAGYKQANCVQVQVYQTSMKTTWQQNTCDSSSMLTLYLLCHAWTMFQSVAISLVFTYSCRWKKCCIMHHMKFAAIDWKNYKYNVVYYMPIIFQ